MLAALARAVQTLTKAGLALDYRSATCRSRWRRTPHWTARWSRFRRGDERDRLRRPVSRSEPMPDAGATAWCPAGPPARRLPGDRGTSFVLAVDFTGEEPQAWR